MKTFYAIFVTLLSFSIAFCAPFKHIKNCSIDEVDVCAQRVYVYGNTSFTFPTTKDATLSHCKQIKTSEQCVREYGRECLKAFGRQYLSLMMNGPSKTLKKTCDDKGITEFLSHKQCISKSKAPLDECQLKTVEDLMKVKLLRKQNWIALICCFLDKLQRCSDKAIEANCDGSSIEYLKNVLRGYQGDINELVCNQGLVWGSKRCKTLANNITAVEAKAKRPYSAIPIILDLMRRVISKN